MNRDKSIITRALIAAGQEPLTEEAMSADTVEWRTVKDIYLPVLRAVIASAEWTELKRRARLAPVAGMAGAYLVPEDCARAISVNDGDEYEIEGHRLYTDGSEPVLLYITDGRRARSDVRYGAGAGEAYMRGKHYTLQVQASGGVTSARWVDDGDDYPDYAVLEFSPEFVECFTASLAAELALKITGNMQLHAMLTGIAQQARQASAKTSRAKAAGKSQGTPFWGDTLGIRGY